MKKYILILFFLTSLKIFSQTSLTLGIDNRFNLNYINTGIISKLNINVIQLAAYYNYDFLNKKNIYGGSFGINFFQSDYIILGTNIRYDQYLYLPSLNIISSISERTFLDINLRPDMNLISAEIGIVYKFF